MPGDTTGAVAVAVALPPPLPALLLFTRRSGDTIFSGLVTEGISGATTATGVAALATGVAVAGVDGVDGVSCCCGSCCRVCSGDWSGGGTCGSGTAASVLARAE